MFGCGSGRAWEDQRAGRPRPGLSTLAQSVFTRTQRGVENAEVRLEGNATGGYSVSRAPTTLGAVRERRRRRRRGESARVKTKPHLPPRSISGLDRRMHGGFG